MVIKGKQSVGFDGTSLLTSSHTSRTMSAIDYSESAMSNLVMENLRDFRTLVKFNSVNELFIYKINGDIVPIANHPFNTFDWKKPYKHIFESIGKWMDQHCSRLIVEPIEELRFGQTLEVDVLADLDCLRYYCELLDSMHLNSSNKVILKIGEYEDQTSGRDRMLKNYFRFPSYMKNRIALTNTQRYGSLDEALYVSKEAQLPVIYSHYGKITDFREKFIENKRAILRSWRDNDGPPVVQIYEPKADIQTDFMSMISYEEIEAISDLINKNDISIIYISDYKDIASVKIANVLTECRGVFLKENCIREWQRYRHLIMAHDPDAFVEMQHFMEKPTSFKAFYHHMEQIMSKFKLMPNDIFAAEELLNDFGDTIKRSERKKAMSYLKERDMSAFKAYCHGLAESYDLPELTSNYYYHLS